MQQNISLLNPFHILREQRAKACIPEINALFTSLGLDTVLWSKNANLCELVTADEETITYRQAMFRDLMHIAPLAELLPVFKEQLETVNELYLLRTTGGRSSADDNESNLYAIKELECFITLVETLYNGLYGVSDRLTSHAWHSLYDSVSATVRDETYVALKEGVATLSVSIKSVKSITVGINLNAALSPYEAGIMSFNETYFRSGDIVSRFMRMETTKDPFITLAPMTVVGKKFTAYEKDIITTAITGALSKVVGTGLREWRDMLRKYYTINARAYLDLLSEVTFIYDAYKAIMELKSCGCPLCYPEIRPMDERCFSATGLYHPIVALTYRSTAEKTKTVLNDITFDREGRIYVLTGANRGGKSVFLCAVGIAQLMAQLGLPVAAASLTVSPVDHIFTHFTTSAGSTWDKGRFAEECERLQSITRSVTANSMFLFDEMLSGTGAFEAGIIAREVITALSIIGARGIYATHIHEFASKVREINEDKRIDSATRVDNLVMEVENGRRTYKVRRRAPDGKSYARDIADNYGLSVEQILRDNGKGDGEA